MNNKNLFKLGLFLASVIIVSTAKLSGEITTKLPHTIVNETDCYIYEAKKGESLYGIAKKYAWNYDELMKYNPDVSGDLKKGEKIYYPAIKDQYLRHEVIKGETIYSISKDYNVPLDSIYKYNPSLQKGIKKGDIILLMDELAHKNANSIADELVVTEEVPSDDMQIIPVSDNTYTSDTILISNNNSISILNQDTLLSDTINFSPFENIRLAVILDEAKAKKDIEFTRGILVALNEMKETPYKINLKVLNGKDSVDNIWNDLENFAPNLIFTTADKKFPEYLLEYGNNHETEIVNVFYLKTNESNESGSVIQILPPSANYNDMIASWIFNENEDRKLFYIGEEDQTDGIAVELSDLFGIKENFTLEDFKEVELVPNEIGEIVLYSYATKKEDIIDLLTVLEKLTQKYPDLDYILIGRSNWMTWKTEMNDKFSRFNVYIPTRVWLDENSQEWINFVTQYNSMFTSKPVKSIPNFAASGYDMTNYFIPLMAEMKGDFSQGFKEYSPNLLQTDILLYKENENSGFQNGISYMIKFLPEGKYEKIIVK